MPRTAKRHPAIHFGGSLVAGAALLFSLGGCGDETNEETVNNYITNPPAEESDEPEQVRNVILMIADGSQAQHEIAYSRYKSGIDHDMVGRDFEFQGWNTTFDVTTYNYWATYTEADGAADISADPMTWAANPGTPFAAGSSFDEESFEPTYGFEPEYGGYAPFPVDAEANDNTNENYTASPKPGIWSEDAMTSRIIHYPATDSASAGTALSCGKKTDKGNIAWESGDPTGGDLETIAELARDQRGMAIGVVSSVEWSHATPATFVSHNVARDNYGDIAQEILTETQPDVVIGAGDPALADHKYSGGDGSTEGTAWFDEWASATTLYEVVRYTAGVDGSTAILAAADTVVANIEAGSGATKLVGIFGNQWDENDVSADYLTLPSGYAQGRATMAFENLQGNNGKHMNAYMPMDGGFQQVDTENPTLAAATEAALKVLSQDEDGFFLMVEGGDIDWANHANDYEWMLGSWHNFDLACQKVVDFIDQEDDDVTWDNTMVIVATDHGNNYMRLKKYYGKGVIPPISERQLCQHPAPATVGVKFSSNDHTNELVTLYAHGGDLDLLRKYEGSWYNGTRIMDNTHIFFAMAEWLRVDPGYWPLVPMTAGIQ